LHGDSFAIVGCADHFLDAQLHSYPIFRQQSLGFEALVGEYNTSLPERNLPRHYLKSGAPS
jgi:hypothetical protein